MKFGLVIPQGWQIDLPSDLDPKEQWNLVVKTVKEAEKLGYDSVWFFDHFHTIPHPGKFTLFECWTALSALAVLTEKVRLGQLVTCALYRNPAYLAKISSIIDVISGGRLELGIGACWYEHEFKGYGYSFPRPKNRIEMLKESVEIIKKMWTEPEVYFTGKYYRIEGGINFPKPVQRPHPPILIGGGGERFTLRVVAMHANKWNYGWGLENYKRKLQILKKYLKEYGRDINDITLTYTADIIVGESDKEAHELMKRWRDHQRRVLGKEIDVKESDYLRQHVVGSTEYAREYLKKAVKELGVKEFIMYMPVAAFENRLLKLLYEEVVKPLKEEFR